MPTLNQLAREGRLYNPAKPVKFEYRPECPKCAKVNRNCIQCTNCGEHFPITSA